jgi:hypothetical protein
VGLAGYFSGEAVIRMVEYSSENPFLPPMIIVVVLGGTWWYLSRVTRKS